MNVFVTDHPLVAQPSCFDAKAHPVLSFLCRVQVVALVLCPVFIGIVWFAMSAADSPDVPAPSWTDSLFEVVGFVIGFPVFVVIQFLGAPTSDLPEPAGTILLYAGVVVDGFFWALVSVSSFRLVAWHRRRRRSTG